MQAIHAQVQKGWPLHKAEVPYLAKPFYNLKDEIPITNGVACIGKRLIVAKNLRKEMLEKIHESHLGEEIVNLELEVHFFGEEWIQRYH